MDNRPLLEVKDLRMYFETSLGAVRAVDGVSFTIREGDTLGIVGESGCGKTVLALSIIRLVPTPPGKFISGNILFDTTDILSLPEKAMRKIRGKEISMIFQEPMTSLNPVFRVGQQIAEVIRLHQGSSRKEALQQAIEMLRVVGIPSPEKRYRDYPHQMSGGMRQRGMIAIALACNPRLMLADEPTTALDVTIQAQILDLINSLKKERGTSVILITHDFGVVAEAAQFVAVMYAGRIVEYAAVSELFNRPCHPYTVGLMNSIPQIAADGRREEYLKVIPGVVPALYSLPAGCYFHDRCSEMMDICRSKEPPTREASCGHYVTCWKYDGLAKSRI
jgi:peptide/nickel transport system ATP-binding protein/oligopeptide transport system ATP-binding protein